MNKRLFLIAAVTLLVMQSEAFSQTQELPKFEVAAEFTTLEREDGSGSRTEPGFGGRFTFNLNKVVSLEAAGYYFPKRCFFCREAGRITEGVGGVKAGKRFEKWGVFAKARPGVISFSEGAIDVFPGTGSSFPISFERSRITTFAMDVGGVVEFYPSKRIVTRFDAGDTIVHFRSRLTNTVIFNQINDTFTPFQFTTPARTTHHFQFMASVGFRF